MSDPYTTIKALRILANDIRAPDDIPAMCLRDAANLIEKAVALILDSRGAHYRAGQYDNDMERRDIIRKIDQFMIRGDQ